MELPNLQTSVPSEVTQTLSDTELFANGARFSNGHFVITDEQYQALQGENEQLAPAVDFEIGVAANPLTIARSGFKKMYWGDRADAIAPKLMSEDPETYIEGVREYVRSVNAAPGPADKYTYLRVAPANMAPPGVATLTFKSEVTDQTLPDGTTPGIVNNLAKQLDRFFTISDTIAGLATDGKGLSLYEKSCEFQKAVREIFLAQHIKLLELAIAAGCSDNYINLTSDTNALFYGDISRLEAAQKQYPEIPSSQLIITFMRRYPSFDSIVAKTQAVLERRNMQRTTTSSSEKREAQQGKAAKDMKNRAARLQEQRLLWQTLPSPGATISLASPAAASNVLFSGIATLDNRIAREFGKSTWRAWQRLPEQNPAQSLVDSLATVPGVKRTFMIALPTERALQEFTNKLPERPSVNPEHALRFGLICTVDKSGARDHFLMDIMYFTVDGETPPTRSHRVVFSSVLTDKKDLSRYLQKVQVTEGQEMALVVQQALNGK